MAELATIARPYAEALFQVSRADLSGTQAWLDGLANAAGNNELLQFAANPKVNASQVFHIVTSVLKNPLPEVARQFRQLANSVSGSSDALIQSAFPIGQGELAELVGTLEKRFGRKLEPTGEVDPSLIGGVRVVVDDEVLDTSVKARLEQMKMALTA